MAVHFTVNRPRRRGMQRPLQFGAGDPVQGEQKAKGDKLLERDVQAATMAILEKHPRVAFAYRMNTGAGYLIGAHAWRGLLAGEVARKAMCRFIRFAFPGCSDILGMLTNGRFVAIECKSTDGELRDDQRAFLSLVNQHGGLGFIVRRPEQVFDSIPLEGPVP